MYHILPTSVRGKNYLFQPIFGCTLSKRHLNRTATIDSKAQSILQFVENPYIIQPKPYPAINRKKYGLALKYYAKTLIWGHTHFYPLVWALSHLRMNVFDNAVEATDAFCQIIGYKNQRLLCVPRSIFAATTSRQFKQYGALFIGGFLPTRHMHAWVIENGQNAYRHDSAWINYQPLAVMS